MCKIVESGTYEYTKKQKAVSLLSLSLTHIQDYIIDYRGFSLGPIDK